MRLWMTVLGVLGILAYAVVGALLMTRWAVVAASGMPLAETIAAMQAANQPYSVVPGVVFAVVGALLAIAWAFVTVRGRDAMSGWVALTLWGGTVALGAPAFFFASFGNMNSVGDTFYDWDAAAAFALEAPLYASSAIAALLAVAALLIAAIRRAAGIEQTRGL